MVSTGRDTEAEKRMKEEAEKKEKLEKKAAKRTADAQKVEENIKRMKTSLKAPEVKYDMLEEEVEGVEKDENSNIDASNLIKFCSMLPSVREYSIFSRVLTKATGCPFWLIGGHCLG